MWRLACRFTLADLLLGDITYSRSSSATSGTDAFDIELAAGSPGVAQGLVSKMQQILCLCR